MFFKIAILLLVLHSSSTQSISFEPSSYVVFNPTVNYADGNYVRYRVMVDFVDPCQDAEAFYVKKGFNVSQEATKFCHEIFKKTFEIEEPEHSQLLHQSSANPIRSKRDANFIETIEIAAATNLFSTLISWVWPDPWGNAISNHIMRLGRTVEKLQNSMNLTAMAMNATLTYLSDTRKEVQRKFEIIPEAMLMTSHIVSQTEMKGVLYRRFLRSVWTKSVNLDALIELLGTSHWRFMEIDQGTIVSSKIRLDFDGIRFYYEFIARRRDLTTNVMTVQTFPRWTVTESGLKLQGLNAPRYVLYNSSSSCLRTLPRDFTLPITLKCNKFNQTDRSLSNWADLPGGDYKRSYKHETQYIQTSLYNHVWCPFLNITIKKKTVACPLDPFKLDLSTNWNTTDVNYDWEQDMVYYNNDKGDWVKEFVEKLQHIDGSSEHSIKTLAELAGRLTESIDSNPRVEVFNYKMTWSYLSQWIITFLIILVVVFIIMLYAVVKAKV